MASPSVSPLVVAAHMGYGHLRAALPLADAVGADVLSMDRAPLADEDDVRTWDRLRRTYDNLSRRAGLPIVGPLDRRLLDWVTAIPRLRPPGAERRPNLAARYLGSLLDRGFGGALVDRLRARGAPLLATFYAPAIVADAAGLGPVVSVLTDADVNRVWAPIDAARSSIAYAVPTARAARRLRAFGVPAERIHRTGFPLPDALTGPRDDAAARRRLATRLVRLDPDGAFAATDPGARALRREADPSAARGPLEVAFAVGGAGAQVELAARLVRALAPGLRAGAVRLLLVAGTRPDTAERLDALARRAGLSPAPGGPVDVLFDPSFPAYARRFHARLLDLDVLFTKPSEITFFGPAGFALALTTPLGAQERANRAWAGRLGAAVDAGDLARADAWLGARRADGALARAAWAAFHRMPREGTRRILALLPTSPPARA